MGKPAAVLRATRAAEATIQSLNGSAGSPQPPASVAAPNDGVVMDDPAPPAAPPVEDFPPQLGGGEAIYPGSAEEGAGFDAGGLPPSAAPDAGGAPPAADNYEHRFKVLQGKYNAETKRLRDANASLEGRLQGLEQVLAQMASARPEPAAPPAPPAPPVQIAPVTQREIDEFGEDMLDAASRMAMQRMMPHITKLQAELTEAHTKLANVLADTTATKYTIALSARDSMFEHLNSKVPDWQTVNTDAEFLNWLEQEEGLSGLTRKHILLQAYNQNDGARVAKFFTMFKAEHAAGSEPATGRQAQPANHATARVNPDALVAPGRGRAAPPPSTQPKLTWTPNSIAQFYADVRAGKFKNNSAERDRLEADIFVAQREGRVGFQQ